LSRLFRLRLICPDWDYETWISKESADQTLEQVLNAHWEFECPVHGRRSVKPFEGFEQTPNVPPKRET
jgi:hypothetical protein